MKFIMLSISGLLFLNSAAFAAQPSGPIRIGVIQPMTGSVAYNGQAYVRGAKLAVAQRNATGGIGGRQVELQIEDGQCQPANSVNAAEKLIQRNKVPVLAGAFCSSATAAVMAVAEKYKIPLLSGVSSKADLTEKGMKYFFRSAETDRLMAKTFSKILAGDLKLKTVAYIGVNDDWGRGGVEDFEKYLNELGVKSVMKEYFDHGTTDYYTLLTKLRALNPDGVFVAAETQDGSILVKQLKEFGIETKVFGVGSWATSDFIGLTGEASEGIYAAVPYVSNMQGDRNRSFVENYQKQYKQLPGKYDASGYNSMNILMQAIERAGSDEPEKIRDALHKTDYDAPNGHFRFTEKGEGYGFDTVLVQIQGGKTNVITQAQTDKP